MQVGKRGWEQLLLSLLGGLQSLILVAAAAPPQPAPVGNGDFECYNGYQPSAEAGRRGLPPLNPCAYVTSDFTSCDRCCGVMHSGCTHNFLSSLRLSPQPRLNGGRAFSAPSDGSNRCWCCRRAAPADVKREPPPPPFSLY